MITDLGKNLTFNSTQKSSFKRNFSQPSFQAQVMNVAYKKVYWSGRGTRFDDERGKDNFVTNIQSGIFAGQLPTIIQNLRTAIAIIRDKAEGIPNSARFMLTVVASSNSGTKSDQKGPELSITPIRSGWLVNFQPFKLSLLTPSSEFEQEVNALMDDTIPEFVKKQNSKNAAEQRQEEEGKRQLADLVQQLPD